MPGLAGLTVFGPITTEAHLTDLDDNFSNINTIISRANTYSNYLVDAGAANTYVVTLPAGITGTLSAGLLLQFKASNANTGASSLDFNGNGAKSIVNMNGTPLVIGQIPAGAVISVIYDGTNFQMMGMLGASGINPVCRSLSRDISLASGNVSYTNFGGTPRLCHFMATTGAANVCSWGYDDGVNPFTMYNNGTVSAGSFAAVSGASLLLEASGGNQTLGYIQSFDADGITIHYDKAGTPTGTASILVSVFF